MSEQQRPDWLPEDKPDEAHTAEIHAKLVALESELAAKSNSAPAMSDRIHDLKILPEFFAAVLVGSKKAEIRKNDRDYRVGDLLRLREWVPPLIASHGIHVGTCIVRSDQGGFSGRELTVRVTNIVHGGQHGIEDGYALLSIESITTPAPEAHCPVCGWELGKPKPRWAMECDHPGHATRPLPPLTEEELDDLFVDISEGSTGALRYFFREYKLLRRAVMKLAKEAETRCLGGVSPAADWAADDWLKWTMMEADHE